MVEPAVSWILACFLILSSTSSRGPCTHRPSSPLSQLKGIKKSVVKLRSHLDSILLVITILLCRSEIVYEDADEVNYLSYLKPRKVGRWSLEGMISSVKLSWNQPIEDLCGGYTGKSLFKVFIINFWNSKSPHIEVHIKAVEFLIFNLGLWKPVITWCLSYNFENLYFDCFYNRRLKRMS